MSSWEDQPFFEYIKTVWCDNNKDKFRVILDFLQRKDTFYPFALVLHGDSITGVGVIFKILWSLFSDCDEFLRISDASNLGNNFTVDPTKELILIESPSSSDHLWNEIINAIERGQKLIIYHHFFSEKFHEHRNSLVVFPISLPSHVHANDYFFRLFSSLYNTNVDKIKYALYITE